MMNSDDSEIFGVLKCARRVWAVAALHGEAARLIKLHQELGRRFAVGDRIVYLGNYLGHGANIVGTLDELVLFRRELLCTPGAEPEDIVYLRGQQEEMWRKLLQLQFAPGPRQVFDWMRQQGVDATLRAYGGNPDEGSARCREGALSLTRWTSQIRDAVRVHPGHDELLASLRRAAYTEGGELLFVHAGIDPHRPLSEQSDTFWWGSGYFAAMAEPFAGFRLVVSGYDRSRQGVRMGPVAATIDGGAGFGGGLNAACFDLTGRAVDWIEA
jgi:serine/threonine protein phosphatase 1